MALYTYEVVNEYARDASRYAIVHGTGCIKSDGSSCSIDSAPNTALKTYLNNQIFPGINGGNLTVTTTYGPPPGLTSCLGASCNSAGNQVTVNVAYPYLYRIPFVPQRSFTMHGTSTMIISQ